MQPVELRHRGGENNSTSSSSSSSTGARRSQDNDREHIDNIVQNGPLHGLLLIAGPLARLVLVIMFFRSLLSSTHQSNVQVLWGLAATAAGTIASAGIGAVIGTSKKREVIGYMAEVVLKFFVLSILILAGVVPELQQVFDVVLVGKDDSNNSISSMVIAGAVSGIVCGIISIYLHRRLFALPSTDGVVACDTKEVKAMLKRQAAEWNPYDVFPTSRSARFWMLTTRILGFVIVSPLEDEVVFRSFLYRVWVAPTLDAYTSVSLQQFNLFSFAFASFLYGAQFLRYKFAWVGGLVLGIVCQLLVVWSGSLLPALVANAVRSVIMTLWVLKKRDWGMW